MISGIPSGQSPWKDGAKTLKLMEYYTISTGEFTGFLKASTASLKPTTNSLVSMMWRCSYVERIYEMDEMLVEWNLTWDKTCSPIGHLYWGAYRNLMKQSMDIDGNSVGEFFKCLPWNTTQPDDQKSYQNPLCFSWEIGKSLIFPEEMHDNHLGQHVYP